MNSHGEIISNEEIRTESQKQKLIWCSQAEAKPYSTELWMDQEIDGETGKID